MMFGLWVMMKILQGGLSEIAQWQHSLFHVFVFCSCVCFELIFVVNMKVVDNCDIFPVALVWHENMLLIIYYVYTKMHDELLILEYDVIWWIVDVWI